MLGNYDDILNRFDKCLSATDGRTDRIPISISRVSYAVLTRDKNHHDAQGARFVVAGTILISWSLTGELSLTCTALDLQLTSDH